MEPKEQWRLGNVQRPCVEVEFLEETHGITWPPDEQFHLDFSTWLRTKQTKPCGDGKPNHYVFEMFLQSLRLLTRTYASAQFGMQPESFDLLLPELPRVGLSKKYRVYQGIIDESLSEDLVRSLRGPTL